MDYDWWLPEETWNSMTEEQQRVHCIKVRAYFLSQQREQNGTPGSPEDDWAAAEQEETRRMEAVEFLYKSREVKDRSERIRCSALYQLSGVLKLRPSQITGGTPLPSDPKVLEELGLNLGWSAINEVFHIPETVTTAGALIEALQKTQPSPPRQIRWMSMR